MNLELDGRIALVTGSSRGIGRAIAEGLLREGARVYLTGRDENVLTDVANELSGTYGSDRVGRFVGDLGRLDVLSRLAETIESEAGRLDVLVCNIGSGRSVPPLEEDEDEWLRMLDINLLSAAACVRALLPLLEKGAGSGRDCASLTFVSSICGEEALGCPVAYSAAKSALISYAKNIARTLAGRGVRVNAVSPGNVIFPGSTWEDKLARDREAVQAMLERDVPLKRLGTAAEVADVVVFLSSKRAAFVTGADWIVDGGQTRTI
ncbi:MAG: SDR family oxidoreductase [Proteobacteria bacterium]|nr:SDR family oxidoreductase [Pseudomonadota bacterium]